MEEILYIKEFYYYTIAFLAICIVFSWLSYWDNVWKKFIGISTLIFIGFSVYYLGNRESNIGVDTSNYKYAFYLYENAKSFIFRKDFLFDFLTYIFAKISTFNYFLIFCAFVYVFGAWYGFRKIFNTNAFLAFSIFIISPYFFQMGINVMRSGMAASLFIIAIGLYHRGVKMWKVYLVLILSLLVHLSMVLPLLMFIVSKFFRKNTFSFILWLFSILLGFLRIDILSSIVSQMGILGERFGMYTNNMEESNAWINFMVFGAFPVLFAMYNIFFVWL